MTNTKVFLVTGASKGLGRALTLAALEAGHRVLATVRGSHDLPQHERLHLHHLDVRDRAGAQDTVAAAVNAFGRLDVLINNAGYGLIGTVEEAEEAEARAIIETNLLGALWTTQAAIPVLRDQGSGHVVQISTVGAVGTMPTLGIYNASKWGLEGFSEALAAEVRQFGVRVTIAEVGGLDTQWATGSMRFAKPNPAYDDLRTGIFGTSTVPWPVEEGSTGGGTPPAQAAEAILAHVENPDERLRVLIGDDAPGQVAAALDARMTDYQRDARFPTRRP